MSDNKNHLNQTSGVTVFKTKKCDWRRKNWEKQQSKHNIFMLMQKMWLT